MSQMRMLNSCMFRVFIESLELTGYHGVAPEERKLGNRFLFDIEMVVDGNADKSDELSGTADYGSVCLLVKSVSDSRSFMTVEALAGAVADRILKEFPGVIEAEVRCGKLLPPVPMSVQSAGAFVSRSRKA